MSFEIRVVKEPGEYAQQIREFAGQVKDDDGVSAFDEQTLLNIDAPDAADYLLLVEPRSGELAGVAIRDVRNNSVELAVGAPYRRRGLGQRLLREARKRFGGAVLWAHGTLPPARALAESENLEATRTLLVMTRPLVGVVDKPDLASAIPGWHIEPIDPKRDLEALTALNAAAFADHPEQGKLTVDDMRQRFAQPWFDPQLLLLARLKNPDRMDDVAGSATTGPGATSGAAMSAAVAAANGFAPDEPLAFLWLKPQSESLVELYVLGVHPKVQGQGLGGALSKLMLKVMRGHGFQQALLYVDEENEPAVRSYRRAGFDVSESHTAYQL
ncbi:GNAT family N-acetyltransferase [Trueperella bialowiezensis]|uniref:Mycothiol acetyltransferase n=1 Tax=Trueperella bialowiezensis TaxID=312285 RepID=A0A3S4VGI2_9ACTO|nr:GNAT family N-acetyltransferase [Trueperella bialowiezensis]VEI13601.1 Mycothiol acetyltransferase [Trueperella bialowiezensis]